MFKHLTKTAVVVVTVSLFSACGGNPAAVPGSAVDTVSLIPTGTTTPTAVPTVSPTVAPATASSCERIGYGDPRAACGVAAPRLLAEMDSAIDRLIANRPALFEAGAVAPWGDPRVIDPDQYYAALIAELNTAGVCAIQKTNSMVVSVKSNNESSEEYQPLTSQRYPWRGKGSYVTGCTPASFPRAPIDHIDYIFVTAYGFACSPEGDLAGTTKGSKPAFPVTCDAHVTATPKTFDSVDVPIDIHGTDIEWELVEGRVGFDQWSWQPFNVTVHPSAPGPIKLCATVQGVRGCLAGQILPPPSPAPGS